MFAAVAVSPAWRGTLRDTALAGLMVVLAMSPTIVDLAESWQKNEAYRYAWLVVPMFVYLVGWHQRARILAETPQSDAAGVVVALVAASGWSVADAANIDIGRQLALLVAFQGIALAALGRVLYLRLLPVMALPLLMLPSADLLLGPLRWLTVRSLECFAWLTGVPFRADGFRLQFGEHSYLVLDACAGLSHVTLTLFLGYCFALLVFRSLHRIVALALFAAALGVLSNVLRVCSIVWIDHLRGVQMDLAAHGRIQWLALLVVLALLFYALLRMPAEATETAPYRPLRPSGPAHARPSVLLRRAPLVAGCALLAIVIPTRALLDDAMLIPLTVWQGGPPAVLAGWELETPSADWEEAGDLRSLMLAYRAGARRLELTLVETRLAGAKLPPARVLPAGLAGWREAARDAVDACDDSYCVRLVHALWKNDEEGAARHVYYDYSIGQLRMHSGLQLRLTSAALRLAGERRAARLVAFSVDGDALASGELIAVQRAIDRALRDAGGQAWE